MGNIHSIEVQIPHEVAQYWGWFLAFGIGLLALGIAAVVRSLKLSAICDARLTVTKSDDPPVLDLDTDGHAASTPILPIPSDMRRVKKNGPGLRRTGAVSQSPHTATPPSPDPLPGAAGSSP